jgi:hypothetical protein
MAEVRIALTDSEAAADRESVGAAAGAFVVTVPYYSRRKGFLFRMAVDYSQMIVETVASQVWCNSGWGAGS